jgi:hypothetical protein
MSDEEELSRWAEAVGQAAPVGDTVVDMEQDLMDLGIRIEAE